MRGGCCGGKWPSLKPQAAQNRAVPTIGVGYRILVDRRFDGRCRPRIWHRFTAGCRSGPMALTCKWNLAALSTGQRRSAQPVGACIFWRERRGWDVLGQRREPYAKGRMWGGASDRRRGERGGGFAPRAEAKYQFPSICGGQPARGSVPGGDHKANDFSETRSP